MCNIKKILDVFNGSSTHYVKGVPLVDDSSVKKQFQYKTISNINNIYDDLQEHLKGSIIIGIIPIDGLYSKFATIDVDEYDTDVDLKELHNKVTGYGGFIFKSKSGGTHIHFFNSAKIEAIIFKEYLTIIIEKLELKKMFKNYEIFPKQTIVENYNNNSEFGGSQSIKQRVGNSINLPFYNGNKSYFNGYEWVNLDSFLKEYDKSIKVDILKKYNELTETSNNIDINLDDLKDLPGCLVSLLNKLENGIVSTTLYNTCVYLRLRYSEEERLEQFDYFYTKYFKEHDYNHSDALKVLEKVTSSDEQFYQCRVIKDLGYCIGKSECKKLTRYGIGYNKQTIESIQEFSIDEIVQYINDSESFSYDVYLSKSYLITCSNFKKIYNYKEFKLLIMEQTIGFNVPKLKQSEWEELLQSALDKRKIIQYTEGTEYSVFKDLFIQFFQVNSFTEDIDNQTTENVVYNDNGYIYNKENKKIYFNWANVLKYLEAKQFKPKSIAKLRKQLSEEYKISRTSYNNLKPQPYKIDIKNLDIKLIETEAIEEKSIDI